MAYLQSLGQQRLQTIAFSQNKKLIKCVLFYWCARKQEQSEQPLLIIFSNLEKNRSQFVWTSKFCFIIEKIPKKILGYPESPRYDQNNYLINRDNLISRC